MLNKGISTAKVCRLLVATSALSVASALGASAAYAQEATATRQFNVPAQPLGRALLDFGRQASVSISAPSEVTRGKTGHAVSGRMTTRQALAQLLEGSGLSYEFVNPTAVRVFAVATPAPTPDTATNSGTDSTSSQDIVVTGTNIRGIADPASPVSVYTRRDIDRSGAGTVQEFLSKLPQNFSSNISESGNYAVNGSNVDNRAGASTVDLRGLGPSATLVLLNGRRMAPSGQSGNFVDISQIPLSAVERIEVLTDGASAIYGSDAVAGIVNFILRDDFNGAETTGRAGLATRGGLEEYRLSQTLGRSWGGGSLLGSVEYYSRSNLSAADRRFASAAALPNDILPEQSRISALVSGHQDIGPATRLSADVLYTHRSTNQTTNTGSLAYVDGTVDQLQLNGGISHTFGTWRVEALGSFSQDKIGQDIEIAGLDPSRFGTTGRTVSTDLRLDGDLATLPGGQLKLAFGAGYRRESFRTSFIRSGAPVGINYDGARNIYALYGEAYAPILAPVEGGRSPLLAISLAGRYEHYSDFGDTFNPKFGITSTFLPGIKLRGTYGRSFVAPRFSEINQAPSAVLFNVPDPASPSGSSVLLYYTGPNLNLLPEKSRSWTAGLDIEPPSLAGLRLSINFFDVRFSGKIEAPSVDPFAILSQEDIYGGIIERSPSQSEIAAILAPPTPFFNITEVPGYGPVRSATDTQVIYDGRYNNLALKNVQGFDISANYTGSIGQATLTLGASGTYYTHIRVQNTVTSPSISVDDTIFNPPDLRIRGSATVSKGPWAATLAANYTDGYRDNQGGADVPVSSWTTVDANFQYQVPVSRGALSGLSIGLSIQNLFDRDPPSIRGAGLYGPSNFGYDPTNANALGRFIALQIGKRW